MNSRFSQWSTLVWLLTLSVAVFNGSHFGAATTAAARSTSQPQWDRFRDTHLPAFDRAFNTFVTDALKREKIAELFTRNFHIGSGRRRGTGGGGGGGGGSNPQTSRRGSTEIGPQGLKQMLNNLKVQVERRYSRAVDALRDLKKEFEGDIRASSSSSASSSWSPGSRPPRPCCVPRAGAGGPLPGLATRYRYEWRYRDLVNVSQVCVGKTAQGSLTPFTLQAENAFRLMKRNYEEDTSILWQYMATTDGHYAQFPAKDRYCDPRGHAISPLTQRWVVDKLLQRKLNLVVLVDASDEMRSVVPRSFPPIQHLSMAKDAAKRIVRELAVVDRVNVVVMTGTDVMMPPGCGDSLMVPTSRNVHIIDIFLGPLQPSAAADADLAAGFQKAYTLLQTQKASQGRNDTNDVIILLTNGEYVVEDEQKVLDVVTTGQNNLDHTVTQMVFLIQSGTVTAARNLLIQLADLNNRQLDNSTGWTNKVDPVGPVGKLTELPESIKFGFSDRVAEFYKFFPRGSFTDTDRISATTPRRDPRVGLILTYSAPVYKDDGKNLSSLHGAVAIDVSMTSLFDDVIYFKWQLDSYGFVVETERDLVLIHPKLDNPSKHTDAYPVFSSLEFLEPTLTADQRQSILRANDTISSFEAQIIPGRTSYRTGQELLESQKKAAAVLFSRLPGSDYVLVMVIFRDESTPEPQMAERNITLGFPGEALYHHHLVVENGTAHSSSVCVDTGDVRINDKPTVKFSPEVFVDPEIYIHSRERSESISDINEFLTENAPPPPIIKPGAILNLVADLKIISSKTLYILWQDMSVGGVVERFIGTPHGVFAAYPGIFLPNAFDGKEYEWYRESMARPRSVWVSLRRSFSTRDKRVSLSSTVGNQLRVFGVTGVAVSRRSFAGLFYNTVDQCISSYTCHLLTDNGYLLDVLDSSSSNSSPQHLTLIYPWLANVLIRRRVMKPVWCTNLSNARHNLTYIVHVRQSRGVSHEASVQDPCRQFLLHAVSGSNLLVLVLAKRDTCSENAIPPESCSSCQADPGGTHCRTCSLTSRTAASSLPSPLPGSPVCQCPCHCSVDFSVCQDSYRHIANATFPLTPCYEEPEMPSLNVPGGPGRPSPAIPSCDELCPSFEKKEDCEAIQPCKWSDNQPYPVCETQVLTTTTSSSTKTITTKTSTSAPTSSQPTDRTTGGPVDAAKTSKNSNGSSLGGGAIAGIVMGVAAVLGVGFLIGYYKLVKPRLFTRLTETASVAEVQEENDSARYHSQTDSLDLTLSSDSRTAPAPVNPSLASSVRC